MDTPAFIISHCSVKGNNNEKAPRERDALRGTGSDLSSRAVSSQVLSALESLTSVFGMGTGGTSPSLPPVRGVFDPF